MTAKERPGPRPTVVIADDHLLVAEGVARLLEDDFEVLGVAGNGRELLELAARKNARGLDLAVLDVSMPELTGVEATRKLREIAPHCKVVLISMHSEPVFVREALHAGASAYLLKVAAPSELIAAIREVLNGNVYVSSGIAKDVLSSILTPAPALSPRQREVLRLVAEGCSAKEVAQRLQIKVKTAQFHKTNIMTKLGVHTTAELTRYALGHAIASY
jgi:DNA-binding NarL/FixJ family response regulator